MSENRTRSPWVFDTRDLGRRPGSSQTMHRAVPVTGPLGLEGVIAVPESAEVDLEVRLDSVIEGVLATGTATAPVTGECSRCLEPISGPEHQLEVEFTELFAYPESTTEETTEEDEVGHLVDGLLDLEPVVRDAAVLALPSAPLCTPDCAGLCPDCGGRWADLGPDHRHETIDPRWAVLTERFHTDQDG